MKYLLLSLSISCLLFMPVIAQEPYSDDEKPTKVIQNDYWTYGITLGKFYPLHNFGDMPGRPFGFDGIFNYETPSALFETHFGFYGIKSHAKILSAGLNVSRYLSKMNISPYIGIGLGAGLLRVGNEKMFSGRNPLEASGDICAGIMFGRSNRVSFRLESRFIVFACRAIDQNNQVISMFRYGPKIAVGFAYRIPKAPVIKIETIIKPVVKIEKEEIIKEKPIPVYPVTKISDIPCSLRVEARLSYFPDIEAIIGNAQYSRNFASVGDMRLLTPDLPIDQQVYEKVYSFTAQNLVVLDSMISDLMDLYRKKHFVFDIVDKLFKSRFISTGAAAGVTVTLFGSVRPGADMWYLQRDQYGKYSMLNGNPDSEGRFKIPIQLEEGQKFVYYVSRYVSEKTTVIVYKKINVFTKNDEEIPSKEHFLKELGISNEEYDRIKKY